MSRNRTAHPGSIHLRPAQQGLAMWTLLGAVAQAANPAWHGVQTPLGALGLWLWLLPAAALGVSMLMAPLRQDVAAGSLAPPASASGVGIAAGLARAPRRRRAVAATTRRERPRPASRADARPGRRAG